PAPRSPLPTGNGSTDMSMYGRAKDGSKNDHHPRTNPPKGATDRLARLRRRALTNNPTHSHAYSGRNHHRCSTCFRPKQTHAAPAAWYRAPPTDLVSEKLCHSDACGHTPNFSTPRTVQHKSMSSS